MIDMIIGAIFGGLVATWFFMTKYADYISPDNFDVYLAEYAQENFSERWNER